MNLIFICSEFPYPPVHGARVDIWRRIQALSEAGWKIHLFCWLSDGLEDTFTDEHLQVVKNVTADINLFYTSKKAIPLIKRAFYMSFLPSHVASRKLSRFAIDGIINSKKWCSPKFVWLDGIYGGELARALSSRLGIPLFVRSHNIEHRYMNQQAISCDSIRRRVVGLLNTLHLRRYEEKLLTKSVLFFDISVDDLNFWQKQGLKNGRWLPPMMERSNGFHMNAAAAILKYDVVYLGNLNTPNNVQGIAWFVNHVLPKLTERLPDIRICIAGSRPSTTVKSLCARFPRNIEMIADPKNASDIYSSGKVLINPVLRGSGVNIKSIEMLQIFRPIVTTQQGVQGMPDEVKGCFLIADSAEQFVDLLLNVLTRPTPIDVGKRSYAEAVFSGAGIIKALDEMLLYV